MPKSTIPGVSCTVLLIAGDAGHEQHDAVPALGGRRVRDELAAHDLLARGVLHVDDRRLAGDGDRLFERADLHVGVDRDRAGAGELDAFALDDAEAGQGERQRVGAGPQIDDLVLAVPSVVTERTFSISAGLAASTVTPGSTAPDVSLTTPASDCANVSAGHE